MPSGEEILEKTLDETAPPNELPFNEQRPRDVEMQSSEPIPEPVCDESEMPVKTPEPTGVEPMVVEEEPQRVYQVIPIEIEV